MDAVMAINAPGSARAGDVISLSADVACDSRRLPVETVLSVDGELVARVTVRDAGWVRVSPPEARTTRVTDADWIAFAPGGIVIRDPGRRTIGVTVGDAAAETTIDVGPPRTPVDARDPVVDRDETGVVGGG